MTNLFKLSTALGLIFSLTSPNAVLAELIIDPDGVGATGVNGRGIRNGVITRPGPVLDFLQGDLRIGEGNIIASGGSVLIPAKAGSVLLNASSGANNIVGFNNISQIDLGNFQSGKLVIDGEGTVGGAFVNIFDPLEAGVGAGRLDMGFGYSSILEVIGGGALSINGLYGGFLTVNGNAESSLRVGGTGSRIDVTGNIEVNPEYNLASPAVITVSNGGSLNANDGYGIETVQGGPGSGFISYGLVALGSNTQLSVTGEGSALSFGSGRLSVRGQNTSILVSGGGDIVQNVRDPLIPYRNAGNPIALSIVSQVGLANPSSLTVTGAGSQVAVREDIQIGDDFETFGFDPISGNFGNIYSAGQGAAVVENNGTLKADSTIYVSGNRSVGSTGSLTVRTGGTVQADKIVINTGGVLNGNGGTVVGDVELKGGTVAPGASPGTMTVNGDFDFFSGIIDFEIGGSNPGEFDMLNVLGNFNAYEGSIFRFTLLAGYTPTATSTFNFLNIGGASNFDLIKPSFQFAGFGDTPLNVFAANGRFSLAATDPNGGGGDPSPVPLPASVLFLAAALFGLTWLKKGKGMVAA